MNNLQTRLLRRNLMEGINSIVSQKEGAKSGHVVTKQHDWWSEEQNARVDMVHEQTVLGRLALSTDIYLILQYSESGRTAYNIANRTGFIIEVLRGVGDDPLSSRGIYLSPKVDRPTLQDYKIVADEIRNGVESLE